MSLRSLSNTTASGSSTDKTTATLKVVTLQINEPISTENSLHIEDGIFEIEVIPGSSFQLKAYDYKKKFSANYNGIIAAIASGKIVENIN